MRTVNGEDLELFALDAADPTRGIDSLSVGGHHIWISKSGQASLSHLKFVDLTQRYPRQVITSASPRNRRQKKLDDGHGKSRRNKSIEKNSQLHEQSPPGNIIFVWHLPTPGAGCHSKQSRVDPGSESGVMRATQARR